MPFLTTFLYSQFFKTPELPNHDFSNQTIIITGSNVGLGYEAAKHFLQLHCAQLIIAVRNTSKGESAKQNLLSTLPTDTDISPSRIQVWPLDLSSSKSIRAFATRASTELERIDVLVENAGIDVQKFALSEDGWETTLQTNVISTCLLALLMLPKMTETGTRFETRAHLVVVTSDVHYAAGFGERDAKDGILKALNNQQSFNASDRYATTKLLQIIFFRQLARHLNSSSPSSLALKHPILVLPTPGLCHSSFFRDLALPEAPLFHPIATASYIFGRGLLGLVARTGEVGARTFVTAACAGEEADGEFMMDGEVREIGPWVLSEAGKRVEERVWAEICEAVGLKGWEGEAGRLEEFARGVVEG